MDMNKYFDMLGPKNKMTIMDNKIKREILYVLLLICCAIAILVIAIIDIIMKVTNSSLIKGMDNSQLFGIVVSLFVPLFIYGVYYIGKELFKELRVNDRIFIWLYFLREKLNTAKKMSWYKLFFMSNRLIGYIISIQNNFENCFIFNDTVAPEIERIKKVRRILIKVVQNCRKDTELKNKLIGFIDLLIDIYGFSVQEYLSKGNMDVNNEGKKQKIEILDKEMDELLDIKSEEKEKVSFINRIKKIDKKVVAAVLIFIVAIVIVLLTITANTVALIIVNLSTVLPVCLFLLNLIYKKSDK